MGKTTPLDSPNCRTYRVPIYGASWLPRTVIRSKLETTTDGDKSAGDVTPTTDTSEAANTKSSTASYIVLVGGGGEGGTGIANEIILTHFDFNSYSLSETPVAKLGTGADLPYRMAVHPGVDGLICAFPRSCRLFEWDETESNEIQKLGVKLSDNVLAQLEDVGQQLAITFSDDGSLLAAGGEDGNLKVFKWPSMGVILHEEQANTAVKGLDFSLDGKFLVCVRSRGPCKVWDVTSAALVASLPRENDEVFGFCRFSQHRDGNQVLYTTIVKGERGIISAWNTSSWKRIASKQIVRDPISAFSVSDDGKLLAIGTIQGDILVINSTTMRVQMTIKKAHLGLVTALAFSSGSRALVSASMDSIVRVTIIEDKNKSGFNYWIIVFIVLLAMIIYLAKTRGLMP